MTARWTVGVLGLLCVVATASLAATWHVEQDGSGEFTVIQDAVDAAAPGDTIRVGSGEFGTVRPLPFWEGFSATVSLEKGGLVIEGAGAGETVIGVDTPDWYYRVFVGSPAMMGEASFTLRDVTVLGGYTGVHYENDNLTIERCELMNSTFGMVIFSSNDGVVRDCQFHDFEGSGVSTGMASSNYLIEECGFESMEYAVSLQATEATDVRDCEIRDCVVGIQYDLYSTGVIDRCRIYGIPEADFGSGIIVTQDCQVTLRDCVIDLREARTYTALFVRNGSVISGSNNVIRGGGQTSMMVGGRAFCEDFYGNEIYRAQRYCLIAQYTNQSMQDPLVPLDMSSNFWGTDDSILIAAWIDDHHDHPNDPQYWMEVIYHPYDEDPVTVEQKSLSEVKALFR